MNSKSELIDYLKNNLSIEIDTDEKGSPILYLYLEDDPISETKIPIDKIFKRISDILYYYD